MTTILGISAFYHDSAAALIIDGEIILAVQEERFSRKKNDSDYPYNSVEFILKDQNITIDDIDYIVFYEKPFLKFERLLESYVAFSPKGFFSFIKSMPVWLKSKLFLKRELIKLLKKHKSSKDFKDKLFFSNHHLSHAASAYYSSSFDEAIVFTADGVGEWATTTIAIGKQNDLRIDREIYFPHSLGMIYSAFTHYIGFEVNNGEYKLMGLASYGNPKYKDLIYKYLIHVKEDGSFRLNQKYFNYVSGLTMINNKFEKLFNNKRREEKEVITQFHMDIASSIQEVIEDIILLICKKAHKTYKLKNLCLAGGVALNCVVNGKIKESNIFDNIWIQPAAGDAGGSIGAALALWYIHLENPFIKYQGRDRMKGSFLGPQYESHEIETELLISGAKYKNYTQDDLVKKVANEIANGKVIGWFQGRTEFGPRALGCRSILADPRSPTMQRKLNLKIKFRESFRPFAPAILSEFVSEWFDFEGDSPYMLFVSKTKESINLQMTDEESKLFGIDKLNIKRSSIPAVTHVDYSSRIQTVHKDTNEVFYKLIEEFYKLTNCPVIINTSFNVRDEPIVNSPKDAVKCFMKTEMDLLAIGNFLVFKETD